MSHSEQCNCSECYVRKQQTPPAPVAQPPRGLVLEFVDPGTTVGQLRDDDGRFATEDQAIRALNATARELGDGVAALRYDLTALCNRIDNHLDGMAQDTATLRADLVSSIAALQARVSEVKEGVDSVWTSGVGLRLRGSVDGMAKRMEEDLSQLTSELEVVKAAVAPKSKR